MKVLNKLQKYIIWSFLFAAVAMIVVALTYMTKYVFVVNIYENVQKCKELDIVYPLLDKFNDLVLIWGVVLIAVFAILCIVGNKYRKKYYISNLVAGCVASVTGLLGTIICLVSNIKALNSLKEHYTAIDKFVKEADSSGRYQIDLVAPNAANVVLGICIAVFVINLAFAIVKFVLSNKQVKNEDSVENVEFNDNVEEVSA